MSKVVPIRIRKHTPVRHPKSRYKLFLEDTGGSISFRNGTLVTDLTRKHQTVSKVPKYDWTEWHKDMNEQVKETFWQRIKRYYKEGLTE